MIGNKQSDQQAGKQQSPGDRQAELVKQLDEVKRYVAGIYSKVDTEIDEIKRVVDAIEKQVRDNDRQIDRIETYDRHLRNIESMVKDIQRKVGR